MTAVLVSRKDLDQIEIFRVADRKLTHFDSNLAGWARKNAHRKHARGRAGEVAVIRYLTEQMPAGWDVVDVSETAATGDVQIHCSPGMPSGIVAVEVKTTNYQHWARYGRLITAGQLETTGAALYVWCVTSEVFSVDDVYIVGWSHTSDVRETSEPVPIRLDVPARRTALDRSSRPAHRLRPESPPTGTYDIDDPDFDENEYRAQTYGLEVEVVEVEEITYDDYDGGYAATVEDDRSWRARLASGAPPWAEGSQSLLAENEIAYLDRVRVHAAILQPDLLVSAIQQCGDGAP